MRTFWIFLIWLSPLPALVLLNACAPRQSEAELQAELDRDVHQARLQRQQILQDYEQRMLPAPHDLAAPAPRVPRTPPVPAVEAKQGSPDARYPRSRQPFADPLLADPVKTGTIVEPLGSRQPAPAPLAPHYEKRSPSTQQHYQHQQNQRREQLDRDFDARRDWQQRRDMLRK